jgi:methylmalonyl-CoA mutase
MEEKRPENILRVDPAIAKARAVQLAELRSRRDRTRLEQTLTMLDETARGPANLVPAILDAVRAEATLGEISATLEKVFGRHQDRPEA